MAERETYGQQFRRLRHELGLTQPEAATLCGVSKGTIAHWELDKRVFVSSDQTANIRRALQILKRKKQYRDRGT